MQKINLAIRIPKELKVKLQAKADEVSLTLSSYVRMKLNDICKDQ